MKKQIINRVTVVVPGLGSLRQEGLELRASLNYIESHLPTSPQKDKWYL